MTEDIYTRAQLLAEAISESQELITLKQAEKSLLADADAQRIVAEFQTAQERLFNIQENGCEPSETDTQLIDSLECKMESNQIIAAYLAAQDGFTEMLDKVNTILSAGMAGESKNGNCDCDGCYDPDCLIESCGCNH